MSEPRTATPIPDLPRYLAIVKGKSLSGGDWYTIEKAQHHNVHTTVMDGPHSGFLFYSGRICDADVEGTGAEMLALADAIEKRERVTFKRCAVDATKADEEPYEVRFWSPRNSRMHGVVMPHDADALARSIKRKIKKVTR